MGAIFVLLIMGAALLVVVALVRGLTAFSQMRPEDRGEDGIPKSLTLQNRMMFSRVKWQAIAIILVAALLAFGAAGS